MKKTFIIFVLLVFHGSFYYFSDISSSNNQKKRYPDLITFAGDFEYYSDYRYNKLSILIKNGKLALAESRNNPIPLNLTTKLNENRVSFKGKKSGRDFSLTFIRDHKGDISRLEFKGSGKPIVINKVPHTVLKDKYCVEELKEDFDQFQMLIKNIAVSPYEFITEKNFNNMFDQIRHSIKDNMNLREFYTLLLPLKEKIGCGHTHLDYPGEYRRKIQNFKFPLIMTFINNRCFLKENLQYGLGFPKYSEILEIEGITIREIIRTLKGDISADGYNDSYKTSALGSCFQYYYANRYGVKKEHSIRFRSENGGKVKRIVIPAIPCSSINYSNKGRSELRYRIIPEYNTAYLSVNSFIYYGSRNRIFFEFVDKAFKEIKEKKINNVIIDLRNNSGGDPYCAAYLLSYIEKEEVPYFKEPYKRYKKLAEPVPYTKKNHYTGDLYFIIDGSNFSTTGHFCALVKYHGLGTFIGTETGSTFTCNSSVKGMYLKNTRIYLKLSTRDFSAAVKGFSKNRGIIPDHIVETTIEDIKSNKDPVLDHSLKIISFKRKQVNKKETSNY